MEGGGLGDEAELRAEGRVGTRRLKRNMRGGGLEGVRCFPKGIFPKATSQVTISKVATSQMYYFSIGNFTNVQLRLG